MQVGGASQTSDSARGASHAPFSGQCLLQMRKSWSRHHEPRKWRTDGGIQQVGKYVLFLSSTSLLLKLF